MKIAIVTEYYYPLLGGITEHVHHFSHEVKKLGHHPIIITGDAGRDPWIDESEMEIIRLGKSVPLYSNGSIARVTVGRNIGKKIRDIFESEKFDIIHIHSPFVPTLPILSQLYADTTTVATFHTHFDSNAFLKFFRGPAQKALDCLHGRISVSQLGIESIERYLQCGDNFVIIPNGVDTEKFNGESQKIEKFNDDKLNIFFLSRLEPRNGLEYLIKAFEIVRRERDNCRLIIGGDGPLKTYYKSLVSSSIQKDIHFVGQINGQRPNYYSTADIFCFPTTKASCSVTLLEAMASSLPLITFTMPAYEAVITSGLNGVLCGEPLPENLSRAIHHLLDSKETRTAMGRRAREKALEYSWDKVTEKVLGYYDTIKIT